jgi:hypothetical protein
MLSNEYDIPLNFGCRFIEIFISHIIFSGTCVSCCCHWSNNLQIGYGKRRDIGLVSENLWLGILFVISSLLSMWLFLHFLATTGGKQLTFSLYKSCLRGVFFVAFDLYPDCIVKIVHKYGNGPTQYLICTEAKKGVVRTNGFLGSR